MADPSDPVSEVEAWLDRTWDPDLTVGEWWETLGTAGWSAPSFPREWYGKGLTAPEGARAQRAIQEFGALGPPGGVGLLLAGPTILAHGTDEQKERYLPDILCGRTGWCQLFSEPAAGSDLAGIQARALRDGDLWRITGQKVWTSSAHTADFGILVSRSDPDLPKHKGLTYFLVDMRQPGLEIRPLRELTGRALFNEVFMTDVEVRNEDVLGAPGDGWAITNTTLMFERSGLGAGNANAAESTAIPGSVLGHLHMRAGDFVRPRRSGGSFSVRAELMRDLAHHRSQTHDPLVRDAIVRLHIEGEIGRYTTLRQKALRESGRDVPGAANIAKLRMSEMFRQARELGLRLLGPHGTLHSYEKSVPVEDPDAQSVTSLALWSPAPSIYGGTDEIQRNILSERVLCLPREAGDVRDLPFREIPKNA